MPSSARRKKNKQRTTRKSAPNENESDSLWTRMLSGPRFVATGLAGAALAVVGAAAGNYLLKSIGEDVHIHAQEDQVGVDDFSFASNAVIDKKRTAAVVKKAVPDAAKGLIKAGVQSVKVVFQTGASKSITVIDLRAVVIRRSPPAAETLFKAFAQGGAGNVQVGVDLNSAEPVARDVVNNSSKLGATYFSANNAPLKAQDSTVFQVKAFPGRYTYDWRIDATIVIDGRREVRTIMNEVAGRPQPFRVTGFAKAYGAAYDDGGDTWKPMNPKTLCSRSGLTCEPASH